MTYHVQYRNSMENPEGFWAQAAQAISWERPFDEILDEEGRWFGGGQLNTCYNCIDRHVEQGRGQQPAIIYDSPLTKQKLVVSYAQLLDQVARFAGLLESLGVGRGDRVMVAMPMTPEALIAMYSCARIGAVHVVVYGSLPAQELAVCLEHASPRVVLTASYGIEDGRVLRYKARIDQAIETSNHKPQTCVVLQRCDEFCELQPHRDLDWHQSLISSKPTPCVPVRSEDPLYILYTSGSTGRPKGVVRDNGGHAVALLWSMIHIYNVKPQEVFWTASELGWVVAHSYLAYGPLLRGCTTLLHEGIPTGAPKPEDFWRVLSEHRVATLMTTPTALRAIKREDPAGDELSRLDLSPLQAVFFSGERLDSVTYHWARGLLDCPLIDQWWQTETGWPVASSCLGIERGVVKPGSPGRPVPGYAVEVLDRNGKRQLGERDGAIVLKRPLPPGCFTGLWQEESRCEDTYFSQFPGYYATGDGGYIDGDGYLFIEGRLDDVIVVSGQNLSTSSIEEVIASHPDVSECAVFGVKSDLTTQLPLALLVLKSEASPRAEEVVSEVISLVRETLGPVVNFHQAAVVSRLPKTRSGKVLRKTLRKLADGVDFKPPASLYDPSVLEEVRAVLVRLGRART